MQNILKFGYLLRDYNYWYITGKKIYLFKMGNERLK
jgi:hypothetical protein